MSWRPQGWKNPYEQEAKATPDAGESLCPHCLFLGYEAGADAMLEQRDKAIAEALGKWIAGKASFAWMCEHLGVNFYELYNLYLDLKEKVLAEEQP